jgi:membrane-bound serine protease (ClpP class)
MKSYLFTLVFFYFLSFSLFAQEDTIRQEKIIYRINIDSDINTTSRIFLRNGLKEADVFEADAVLIRLNTYGGAFVDADSMRTAILYNKIPVHVFIDNNAASAGALISIACEKIFMRPGASIGAATVVDGTSGEQAPDKYQSYMRSLMRSTAETRGRDPLIAEAMVDNHIHIPNVVDSGKTLTFTAQEALKFGFCDGIADTQHEVISKFLGFENYKIVEYKPTFLDKLKGFLMSPAFQAILIMIIIAGIYFELQSPGIGFPSIVAITAAILYFTPLYIDGFVQHWELIVFILGIILVFVELFVFPGFGIAGISGITFIALGLIFALINNDFFNFENVEVSDVSRSVLTVLSGLLFSFISILWLSSRIGEKGLFRKIALTADLENSESVNLNDFNLIGQEGKAMTDLRPSGKVFINNEVYDAVSNGFFIEKDTLVKVVKFENMQIYVETV